MEGSSSVPVLSLTISVLVAGFAAGVVALLPRYFEALPNWIIPFLTIFIVPLFAYGMTISGSTIYQYGMCKKVNMKSVALGNLIIYGLTTVVSLWLAFENMPILKYIFGQYGPTNPNTGEQYTPDTVEYQNAMESERHYKLQPLSGIVKAVLPVYYSDPVKDGLSYMYWIFWATMLPSFFLFSVQGASC